ncbi:MAG: hypothetical protein JWR21_4117 [Herminiimonas sp.]|nr:hypothetical protein [Herminiimonas sp.]MDB5853745.1 hypothetical protein [Herminiimonas sp.]
MQGGIKDILASWVISGAQPVPGPGSSPDSRLMASLMGRRLDQYAMFKSLRRC